MVSRGTSSLSLVSRGKKEYTLLNLPFRKQLFIVFWVELTGARLSGLFASFTCGNPPPVFPSLILESLERSLISRNFFLCGFWHRKFMRVFDCLPAYIFICIVCIFFVLPFTGQRSTFKLEWIASPTNAQSHNRLMFIQSDTNESLPRPIHLQTCPLPDLSISTPVRFQTCSVSDPSMFSWSGSCTNQRQNGRGGSCSSHHLVRSVSHPGVT